VAGFRPRPFHPVVVKCVKEGLKAKAEG
jgi:hypothetical protein